MRIATVTVGVSVGTLDYIDEQLVLGGFLEPFGEIKNLSKLLQQKGIEPSITPVYVDLIEWFSNQSYAQVIYENIIPEYTESPNNFI